MVKLNKNRSKNFLAFVSTRAISGSRPKYTYHSNLKKILYFFLIEQTSFKLLYILVMCGNFNIILKINDSMGIVWARVWSI